MPDEDKNKLTLQKDQDGVKNKKTRSNSPYASRSYLRITPATHAKYTEKIIPSPSAVSQKPNPLPNPTPIPSSQKTSAEKEDSFNERPHYPDISGSTSGNQDQSQSALDKGESIIEKSPDFKWTSISFPQQNTQKSSARSKFRKIAAVLAFARKRGELKQISPNVKALVDSKKKVSKIEPEDLELRLVPHKTQSLFSFNSNDTSENLNEDLKTEILEASANTAYVVSDPLEKHYLVESTINKLYAYFLTMLIFVALLSSICTYALQHIPPVFARDVFYKFFWYDMSNIIVLAVILLMWFLVGSMFLVCPRQRDWNRSIRKVRWIILMVPFILMHVCHLGWNINLTKLDDEYYPALTKRMEMNLRTSNNGTLLLSQSYFGCCGVHAYTDWDKPTSVKYHGGYPQSCCTGLVTGEEGCAVPIHSHTRNKTLQVWPIGCLKMETRMINAVVMVNYTMLTILLISMYVALFYLVIAINIILKHEIIVHLPF